MTDLTFVPPALVPRRLRQALDRRSVWRLVQEHLAPGRDLVALTPSYLRFKSEDGSLVGWRAQFGGAESLQTFVTLRVASPGRLADEAEQLAGREYQILGGLQPWALAEDGELLLLAFPVDRVLRELRHWTRVRQVRRLLVQQLKLPKGAERPAKEGGLVEVVRYKPERRAVLRWDFPRKRADAPRLVYFLRVHAQERAVRAARAEQAALAAGVRCPQTLVVPHGRLAIESELPGQPLATLTLSQAEAAGALLARLHTGGFEGLPRMAGPVEELDAVLRAVLALQQLAPELGAAAEEVADRLAQTVPTPSAPVLLHGDFHAGQLLEHAGEMGIVDFDRAGAGYAAYDLASFAAALQVAGRAAGELVGALERGYASRRPLPAAAERAWFEAAALVRGAPVPFRTQAADWVGDGLRLIERAAWLLRVGV